MTELEAKIVGNLIHGKPAVADIKGNGAIPTADVLTALRSLRESGTIARPEPGAEYELLKLPDQL